MKKSLSILTAIVLVFLIVPFRAMKASAADYSITLAELGDQVVLHTDLQEAYLQNDYNSATDYAGGTQELSRPKAVRFSWTVSPSVSYVTYSLKLSKSPDMTDAETFTSTSTSLSVYNLEIGRTYYWQVDFTKNSQTTTSPVSSFTTENLAPRNLYIDGITNVRDIGGYTTLDGKVVRQGRIYRCSKLNENTSTKSLITSEGKKEFVERLGVKTEIDLRRDIEYGHITSSPLGSSVQYLRFPMEYETLLISDNLPYIKQIFETFADEKNYPIIFHCSIGTDRTGCIAYLLEGLLGMSESDMIRDYLFSNFANIDKSRAITKIHNQYPRPMKNKVGDTLQQKIYTYLSVNVGISTEVLDKVIELNLEDPETGDNYLTVSDEAEFAAMQAEKKYRLTEDLNLTQSYLTDFKGVLDGDGHTVTTDVAMFETLSGEVRNINIRGNISETSAVGAVAKTASGAKIIDVTNAAAVTSASDAGGLVGYAARTLMIRCTNRGTVCSEANAGGIVGRSEMELSLSKCVNSGAVESASTTATAGGIVGKVGGAGMVQQCMNSGEVRAKGNCVGGIAGELATTDVMQNFISDVNCGRVVGTTSTGNVIIGGIVGHSNGDEYFYLSFVDCVNDAELVTQTTGTARLAGICGTTDATNFTLRFNTVAGKFSAVNSSSGKYYTLYRDTVTPTTMTYIKQNNVENRSYPTSGSSATNHTIGTEDENYEFFKLSGGGEVNVYSATYREGRMVSVKGNSVSGGELLMVRLAKDDPNLTQRIFFLSPDFVPVMQAVG